MAHLSDGILRRLYDEPLAIAPRERRHYDACARCQHSFATIAASTRASADLLAVPDAPINPVPAYAAIRRRVAAEGAAPAQPWYRRSHERIAMMYHSSGRRLVKPLGGVLAAAAIVGALSLTPAGSLAQGFLTIFQPTQFVAVPVTTSDLQGLRSLRDLGQFGTVTQYTHAGQQSVTSAAQAASATGLTVLTPASLPVGTPSNATYMVIGQSTGSFTFSAAKARAYAASSGKTLTPMPASLDGSTLQLSIGPVVAATYGGNLDNGGSSDVRSLPTLLIAEAAMPHISSTGASVTEMRDYLLQQPGVSPQLAAEIRAIGDPSTTLPIPIPVDRATAQSVQVQGVSGLAVGDNTGLGSGVIWQNKGVVYGVAGALPMSQVLSIANSLH